MNDMNRPGFQSRVVHPQAMRGPRSFWSYLTVGGMPTTLHDEEPVNGGRDQWWP
jgi:hypothetical protein